jgi:hypothetical protein
MTFWGLRHIAFGRLPKPEQQRRMFIVIMILLRNLGKNQIRPFDARRKDPNAVSNIKEWNINAANVISGDTDSINF